ncbi:hypothetical protein D9758_006522 [Tetrapyrgos nigripes]|uniref:Uncharacterized protein n=1 Tax=Tetrapyrgos nigripes TaxID=182062 RepID=A0A8H5LQY9_9AGAR|nr:hypothetical protein D9758_006522 [Tetrapyrgos nigripes]
MSFFVFNVSRIVIMVSAIWFFINSTSFFAVPTSTPMRLYFYIYKPCPDTWFPILTSSSLGPVELSP